MKAGSCSFPSRLGGRFQRYCFLTIGRHITAVSRRVVGTSPLRCRAMLPQAASESVAAQFTACVRRQVAGDLPPIELIAAAEAMTGRGETALAERLYKLWIERNSGDPLLHAIKFNYGVLLREAGEIARAKEALGDAIRLRPDFLPPYVNLGNLLEREGAPDQAVRCWLQVLGQLPAVKGEAIAHKTAALKQLGCVLEGAFDAANAEEALRLSL